MCLLTCICTRLSNPIALTWAVVIAVWALIVCLCFNSFVVPICFEYFFLYFVTRSATRIANLYLYASADIHVLWACLVRRRAFTNAVTQAHSIYNFIVCQYSVKESHAHPRIPIILPATPALMWTIDMRDMFIWRELHPLPLVNFNVKNHRRRVRQRERHCKSLESRKTKYWMTEWETERQRQREREAETLHRAANFCMKHARIVAITFDTKRHVNSKTLSLIS